MAAFEPQAFGKYFLVDKIATGGMAEIFKAKTYSHGGFENLLVIKRILPHIGENDDFIEMFIDEAKVSVALQHPNIVRIYDFGKILENFFIAMECVDGKDTRNCLKQLARRRQYMPPKFCAYIAHEVCKGLHYAHSKTDLQGKPFGIIHRDISPSNVLVSYEGEVKIADFGIAKAESNAYQTQDGILKGKFEYMSPEQATGKEIDARSDIFSLGIILYETLTGRRLFKTKSEVATLKKIRDCDFEPPTTMNPNIPPALEAIAMKALTQYPDDRYSSAAEMAEALRDYLLPQTPDTLRAEFQTFLAGIFQEEIATERDRLETNSEVAARLREQMPEGWEGSSTSTLGTSLTQPGALRNWAIGAFLVILGLGATVVGGAYYVLETMAEQEEVATTGTVEILVVPDADIFWDGEKRGRGGTLKLPDMSPGEHKVRFEAEGYESYEAKQWVVAGEVLTLTHTMKKAQVAEMTPEPAPAATAAQAPKPKPKPVAASKGKLTVLLQGGGWASVYMDGAKLSKNAPFKDLAIAPGNHTIRVENAALGLKYEEQISVSGGGAVTVRAKP